MMMITNIYIEPLSNECSGALLQSYIIISKHIYSLLKEVRVLKLLRLEIDLIRCGRESFVSTNHILSFQITTPPTTDGINQA